MNVFKIKINIEYKISSLENRAIKDYINYAFKDSSTNGDDYNSYLSKSWNSILYENVKALYTVDSLKALGSQNSVRYFIFDTNNDDSKKQVDYEVLIISQLDNINTSYNLCLKLIKKHLKECKISVVNKKAYIYIYDGNDIVSNEIAIKASINKISFTLNDAIRYFFTVVAVAILLFSRSATSDLDNDSVINSILATIICLVVSEVISKFGKKTTLEIVSLSNCIERTNNPFSAIYDDETVLDTPEI